MSLCQAVSVLACLQYTERAFYLSTGAANDVALRAGDGSLLWQSPNIGQVFDTPIVVGNQVYASAINGIVYALQAATGSVLWYYQTVPGT